MKKTMMTATGILFAFAIHAQEPPAPPPPPKQITVEERIQKTNELLDKEMQLTDQQKRSIESAFKKFFIATDQLRNENPPPLPPPPPPPPLPDPKMKAAMDKLLQERDEEVKKVLSVEEFNKFKEAEKKMHLPKPPRNDAPAPPKPLDN